MKSYLKQKGKISLTYFVLFLVVFAKSNNIISTQNIDKLQLEVFFKIKKGHKESRRRKRRLL